MATTPDPGQPIAITGATGTLGRAFARICERRGLPYRLTRRQDMDVAEPDSVARLLDDLRPRAVINTAGYVRVDDAERDRDACFRENARGPAVLAEACARRGIGLVTFSSDLVFDGTKGAPYVEDDPPNPLNVYGESKAEAERRVLEVMPSALVVRTSAFFGPWDEHNFVTIALRMLSAGDEFVAASDGRISPSYVPDLVDATLDLLEAGAGGLRHVANDGSVSWAELATTAARLVGLDEARVRAVPTAELHLAARRPPDTTLASARGILLPSLSDALERYLRESDDRWHERAAGPAGAARPPG